MIIVMLITPSSYHAALIPLFGNAHLVTFETDVCCGQHSHG